MNQPNDITFTSEELHRIIYEMCELTDFALWTSDPIEQERCKLEDPVMFSVMIKLEAINQVITEERRLAKAVESNGKLGVIKLGAKEGRIQ